MPWRSSAPFSTRHRRIERRLPAERRQERLRAFTHENLLNRLGSDGLNIGAMRKLRIRHDGGRVGVDENDFVSFFGEGLASLDPGIVKFAPLPDNDGT